MCLGEIQNFQSLSQRYSNILSVISILCIEVDVKYQFPLRTYYYDTSSSLPFHDG